MNINNSLFSSRKLHRKCRKISYNSLIIIRLVMCDAGDRQNTYFSPGSGTQTASRFSSTSCLGSSYFSFYWPWWRPSLGRPPVPACRTSIGTPPIQCKSQYYTFVSFSFISTSASSFFRIIIFYHTGHFREPSCASSNSDALEMPRSMLLYEQICAYPVFVGEYRALSLFHRKKWGRKEESESKILFKYVQAGIATALQRDTKAKNSALPDNIVTLPRYMIRW